MLTALLFNTGWYITNAMGIYYFDKVMGDKSYLSYFAAIGGVGQALGLFLLPVLSKRFTRRRVIQGAMIMTIIGYAGMFISGPVISYFIPFAVFALIGCIGIGCIFVSQTVMLADIVDYGEYSLGYRSESIVFSMKGFLQKLAYTIQAIVIALGLIMTMNGKFIINIYNTLFIMIVAYMIKYLMMGMRTIVSAMSQIHESLEEAAQISGAGWIKRFKDITIPLIAPSVVAGWFLIFMPCFYELTMSTLLYSTDTKTIGFELYQYQTYHSQQTASAMASAILIFVVLVNWLLNKVTKGKFSI